MITECKGRVATYRDGESIVLMTAKDGRTTEIYLTPEEAWALIEDLAGQIFRLTGARKPMKQPED
jgi:hypothetical protein